MALQQLSALRWEKYEEVITTMSVCCLHSVVLVQEHAPCLCFIIINYIIAIIITGTVLVFEQYLGTAARSRASSLCVILNEIIYMFLCVRCYSEGLRPSDKVQVKYKYLKTVLE